jgi:hypothetical protein
MKPKVRITADEWRAEIERVVGRSSDQGMTLREIAAGLGISPSLAARRLGAMAQANRLGTGRRASRSISGRPVWTPVYWIMPKK